MQSLGLELSCNTYDGFIRALVSVKGFRDGMEVVIYDLHFVDFSFSLNL